MRHESNNYAFIDSQNLHLGIRDAGWKLDFRRFRIYLEEKYKVTNTYLFIGYIEGQQDLYKSLQEMGYICIFKPTLKYRDGMVKGNCDAELVLQAMIEINDYNKAVIVSGDGDFHCLIKYLVKQDKLCKLLVPNQKKYSALLKRFPSEYLAFITDLKHKLEIVQKEKNPVRTKP